MDLIQDCISECNYLPLGYDKKVVLIDDCYFLSSERIKNKLESDQDYKSFISYIENPNPSTELIVVVHSKDLNEKNEIVKLLKEKAKVSVASAPDKDTFKDYIKKYVNLLGASIDNDAINELAMRCEGNVSSLESNCKKLALYSNHITFDDVCLMVTRPLDENIFQIYNFLLNHRNDEAIRLYHDLLNANVDTTNIISNISNQFRLLNEVSFLSKTNKSPDEIASILNIKPVRAQIIRKQVNAMSESTIRKVLDELYSIDLQTKSGQIDRVYAFEMFLINFKAE